jgi:3-deoxy-D-manno-octulosonic-acid transferase
MGPHTFNFEEAAELAAASTVAFRVDGLESAIQCGLQLGSFDRDIASNFVATNRGAAAITALRLTQLI